MSVNIPMTPVNNAVTNHWLTCLDSTVAGFSSAVDNKYTDTGFGMLENMLLCMDGLLIEAYNGELLTFRGKTQSLSDWMFHFTVKVFVLSDELRMIGNERGSTGIGEQVNQIRSTVTSLCSKVSDKARVPAARKA